jgi:hypothetical protein
MTGDTLPFASGGYSAAFSLLLFARGMDFLSTWVATPNLVLEGNPLARKMGWKWGGLANLALCFVFAFWPLTAIIVMTAGLLVAAHNFHSAWLMRTMGEAAYRDWFLERMAQHAPVLLFRLPVRRNHLDRLPGAALIWFCDAGSIPFAIGYGIVATRASFFFTLHFPCGACGGARIRKSRVLSGTI